MYFYNLVISVFSNDEKLLLAVKNIKPCENFSYEINIYNEYNENVISSSDIIILDEEFNNLEINNLKDGAKVVLCNPGFNTPKAHEILEKPFNYELVSFRINKLIESIKKENDYEILNNCLNTIIDTSPDMIWVKRVDGIHTKVNKKFCEIVGKNREDVEGQDHYTIWNVSPDDPNSGADVCKRTEDEVTEAKQTRKFQENIKINNDEPRQLDTYKSPIYDKYGNCLGTIGFGHDITDIKNLSAVNGVFFENVPYPALIRNNAGLVIDVNHFFEKYFGINRDDIVDTPYDEWAKKTFYPERTINESGFVEGKTYPINGIKKIAELRFTDIPDIYNKTTGQICIFRDVTIERQLEEKNYNNSITDAMTHLYNRRYFSDFMDNQTGLISFLSIDLDHFKSVNDNYGHPMGDKAIILTADILKECFPADTVVRMGGDEFLVIKVGNYTISDLKGFADHLLNRLNTSFKSVLEFEVLSASMGIAQGLIEEEGLETLMKNSDDALYKAKESGRSCYCVYGE